MDGASFSPVKCIGYDVLFGSTRVYRVDANQLADDDPLAIYSKLSKEVQKYGVNNVSRFTDLMIAFHQFQERSQHLPSSENRQTRSQPPHSWRVAILPLIGRTDLYQQYQFDEPWDSETNKKLLAKMPDIFRSDKQNHDSTSIVMIVGDGAFCNPQALTKFSDVTDGKSNTPLFCCLLKNRFHGPNLMIGTLR